MESDEVRTADRIFVGRDSVPVVEPHEGGVELLLGGRVHVEDPRGRIDIEAGAQIDADDGGRDVWHGGGCGGGVWQMDEWNLR